MCPILLGITTICQRGLISWARRLNIQIKVNPTTVHNQMMNQPVSDSVSVSECPDRFRGSYNVLCRSRIGHIRLQRRRSRQPQQHVPLERVGRRRKGIILDFFIDGIMVLQYIWYVIINGIINSDGNWSNMWSLARRLA